jgi:NAD(P)-dependent dehydrogenase (short-subunit alcohol dehydrogenase family)
MEPLTADLEGRIAVITGGTRGIGRMLVEGLADAGAFVEVVARRPEELDETVSAVGPDRCRGVTADLASDDGIEAAVKEITAAHDSVHLLINNAATSRFSPLDAEDHSFARWDKIFRLNVAAPFLLTVRLLPLLEAGSGRVINIGSIDGMRPPDHDAHAYAASKAALHHLTQMLAPKLGRRGILINVLAPSAFASRMSSDLLAGREDELATANPLGRLGQPDDIVGVVRFMASDSSRFINGAVIPVDGSVRLVRVPLARPEATPPRSSSLLHPETDT